MKKRNFKDIILLLVLIMSSFLISCSSGEDSDDNGDPSPISSKQDACQVFSFARTKIANGEVCSAGTQQSPLVRLLIETSRGTGTCTGSVIDSDTILTAAHCLEGQIFSITVDTTAGTFAAVDYFSAAGFNNNVEVSQNDIAIVKTGVPMPITPLPLLLSQNPIVGEDAFIGGFGETSPGSIDSFPRAGNVEIAAVTSNHVIIRFQGDQAHPCQGDSGGPLVVIRNGQEVIVGVVSQSDISVDFDQICRKGDVTLYTGLRTNEVLNFLGSFAANAGAL